MSDLALVSFAFRSSMSPCNLLTSSYNLLISSFSFLYKASNVLILLFFVLMASLAVDRSFFALLRLSFKIFFSPYRVMMAALARSSYEVF